MQPINISMPSNNATIKFPENSLAIKLASNSIDIKMQSGIAGVNGTNGTNGTNGVGVPTGGTTGQVLAKNSNTNYDTLWETLATVATTGAYSSLSGLPTLGTLAALNSVNLATNVGTTILSIANGGTGSTTQNFVDLSTTAQNKLGNLGLGNITPTYGLHQLGGGQRLQALATPTAPTVTPTGTAGTTSYTYFVVATDRNGGKTLASGGTTITTGNATLSSTDYNTISWTAIAGAVSYDVLKTNSSTSLATGVTALSIDDTGQATASYTAPSRNTTADVTVDGNIVGAGSAGFSGYFNENATVPGIYFGGPTGLGTPRIQFNNGSSSQSWEIDNDGGTFRWFLPGNLCLALSSSSLTTYGNFLPNTNNSLTLGSTTNYWSNLYATRQYLNSTAYLDGSTAGVIGLTGALSLGDSLYLRTAGNKLNIATGTNASIGTATLVAGTVTVSTTAVTASSIIMLTNQVTGGTVGVLSKGTVTAGSSFVINSTSATETSTVSWWIIN